MSIPTSRLLCAAALLAAPLAGCDSDGTDSDASSVRILLTDAPGDFERAIVTIDEVYLQGSDDGDGRTLLRDDAVTVDLLDLQNEVLTLVEDRDVPEGSYGQLRLVISEGLIEVENEDGGLDTYASSEAFAAQQGAAYTGALQMPSYSTSGLKVNLPPDATVDDDGQRIILLDFDVADSFGQQAGNSGRWVLRPTIHATDFALTGSAEVTLALADGVALPDTLALGDFSATLSGESDPRTVAFDDADGDGVFSARFRYLAPGSYQADVAGPEAFGFSTDVALPASVTITSGGTVSTDVVVTGVDE